MCQVSCVMCRVSCVMCPVSWTMYYVFFTYDVFHVSHILHHVPCVMCNVSCTKCNVSCTKFHLSNPKTRYTTVESGRGGARRGGRAGRGRAGRDSDRSVRPEDKSPPYPPNHRKKPSWGCLWKHEQTNSYLNRWRNKNRGWPADLWLGTEKPNLEQDTQHKDEQQMTRGARHVRACGRVRADTCGCVRTRADATPGRPACGWSAQSRIRPNAGYGPTLDTDSKP